MTSIAGEPITLAFSTCSRQTILESLLHQLLGSSKVSLDYSSFNSLDGTPSNE